MQRYEEKFKVIQRKGIKKRSGVPRPPKYDNSIINYLFSEIVSSRQSVLIAFTAPSATV